MQIRFQILAHQREETGDSEGLVAVPQNLPVDGVPVVLVRDEGDDGVDGEHEEDADDVFLLAGVGVVHGVQEDEGAGYEGGEEGEEGCEGQA